MTENITLVLDFAIPDWGDCALCGEHLLDNDFVGMAVRGGGRVCEDCTDKHSPSPGGYDIARALSHIDMALTAASPQYRHGLLCAVLGGMKTLENFHHETSEQQAS